MRRFTFNIQNWTRAYALELSSHKAHGEVPALIGLSYLQGPMSYHHSITPDQAREMAAALIALADDAERLEWDSCMDYITTPELEFLGEDIERDYLDSVLAHTLAMTFKVTA